jgi:hypothetical protein
VKRGYIGSTDAKTMQSYAHGRGFGVEASGSDWAARQRGLRAISAVLREAAVCGPADSV